MMKTFKFLVFSFLTLIPAYAVAKAPSRDPQEESLTRGVYSEGRLWLLSDGGQLFSLSEADKTQRKEDLGENVLDICRFDNQLIAITTSVSQPTHLILRERQAGQWEKMDEWLMDKDERLIGLVCNKQIKILTSLRMIWKEGTENHKLALTVPVGYGVASLFDRGDSLLVGFNRGEWGGGLQSIDSKTGQATALGNEPDNPCTGAISTECDPVNGLAALPWHSDCVVVAVGLIHFLSRGRIVSVCGEQVEILFRKQFGKRSPNPALSLEDAYQTIPFYGLASEGDKLLAVGANGLYRISADGQATYAALPKFKKIGPFSVSFTDPENILVMTTVNERQALSGAVPMLVPR